MKRAEGNTPGRGLGRRRSIKLVEENDQGASILLMQNHPDDCFESEVEDVENSMTCAVASAANDDSYSMCTRCGEFPQSARKTVQKGLCCNRCPNHGPWCSGHAPCTRQRCKPGKKRARVEAEDSDSSQLPIWPGRTSLSKGGGTFVVKDFHEENSTTISPPQLEGQTSQSLTTNLSESNECASFPVASEIETGFREVESTTTPPPSLEGQTSQNLVENSSKSNETLEDGRGACNPTRRRRQQKQTNQGTSERTKKRTKGKTKEPCTSVPVASKIEGDLHEKESTTIPLQSMERQISQNLRGNSETNECVSVPALGEKARRLLAPKAAARPTGLLLGMAAQNEDMKGSQSDGAPLPLDKSPLVVSDTARRLLAPKAAARPMGLWHRIAKRKEHMRNVQSKGIPLSAGMNYLATDTVCPPHDQAAVVSPETILLTDDTVVSGAGALAPNLTLTDHPSTESIGVVNEVTPTQDENQVANNRGERVTLGSVRNTPVLIPEASTRPTKKVAKENLVRPNKDNRRHYTGFIAVQFEVSSPKKHTPFRLRTPLASIDMNACGLRC